MIYVAANGSNSISVISGATNTVTATIAAGSDPDAIAVNPNTNTIYVANGGEFGNGATVSLINGDDNTVTTTVPIGPRPVAVAVDPDTNMIYVVTDQAVTLPPPDRRLRPVPPRFVCPTRPPSAFPMRLQ